MRVNKEDDIAQVMNESPGERTTIEEEEYQAILHPSLLRRLLPIIVAVAIIVCYFIFSAIYQGAVKKKAQEDGSGRVKLEADYKLVPYMIKTSAYSSKDILYEKMSAFYVATGVQPCINDLTDEPGDYSDEELQAIADECYADTFSDEYHLLIVFRENSGKKLGLAYHVGSEARAVLDDEALELLTQSIEKYFNDAGTPIENKLAMAMAHAKDEIMGPSSSSLFVYVIMFALVVSFLVYIVSTRYKRYKKNPNYLGTPTDARYELYRRSNDRFL